MPLFTDVDIAMWEQECDLILDAEEYERWLDELELLPVSHC